MIRILATDSGEWLDIASDAEFEIEISSPIFESERIPAGVSTTIAFPPTDTNKRLFGYVPALFLPPKVTSLSAAPFFNGIPLFYGLLSYDNVDEDGNLNYIFAEKGVEDAYGTKLYELSHLPSSSDAEQLAEDILSDNVPGVAAPLLFTSEAEGPYRYLNANKTSPVLFTPCVSFPKMFQGEAITIGDDISGIWNNLWLVGSHKAFSGNTKGFGSTLDIADTMPDANLSDALGVFAGMVCSFVFSKNRRLYVVSFNTITSTSPKSIDGKVLDSGATFQTEKGQGYKFGYEKEYSSVSPEYDSNSISDVSSYKEALDNAAEEDTFVAVRLPATGEIFSVAPKNRYVTMAYGVSWSGRLISEKKTYTSDVVLDNNENTQANEGKEDMFDGTVKAKLVTNFPIYAVLEFYKIAAKASIPAAGNDRKSELYVGIYGRGQLSAHGYVIGENDTNQKIADSITAPDLYSRFHTGYASWLAQERQILNVDVNFSAGDIAEFRMWTPVLLRHRRFLAKKLTIRASVRHHRMLSSLELVSL